jgi:hypothetical protein
MDVSSGDSRKRDIRQVGQAFDEFEEGIARRMGQVSLLTRAVVGLSMATLLVLAATLP